MSGRLVPILLAAGVGVVSGVYIWNEPLQQVTGLRPSPEGTKPVIEWQTQDGKAAEQEKPNPPPKVASVDKVAGAASSPAEPPAGTPNSAENLAPSHS
ncbi:uncharacterized protein COLE_04398 [Cutaneotrichosporon oleaginosum]|nr:hypothetical protein COLE_04398 [Cutaneotrichosporon oleaginosum]